MQAAAIRHSQEVQAQLIQARRGGRAATATDAGAVQPASPESIATRPRWAPSGQPGGFGCPAAAGMQASTGGGESRQHRVRPVHRLRQAGGARGTGRGDSTERQALKPSPEIELMIRAAVTGHREAPSRARSRRRRSRAIAQEMIKNKEVETGWRQKASMTPNSSRPAGMAIKQYEQAARRTGMRRPTCRLRRLAGIRPPRPN